MSTRPPSRTDRRPPYHQAADEVRADILLGRIKPGEQLPSVRVLSDHFGLAGMTVRNALDVLRDEGPIYTVHGRGSFATDLPDRGLTNGLTPPAQHLKRTAEPKAAIKKEPRSPADRVIFAEIRSLRHEVTALRAQHEELRRDVDALMADRQQYPAS